MNKRPAIMLLTILIAPATPAWATPSSMIGEVDAVSVPTTSDRAGAADKSTTSHSTIIKGRALRYHATAGRLPVKDDEDRPKAHMFYVSYTKDGSVARDRPVTFLFNGGPGSSSIYLHLGSFGPARIAPPQAVASAAPTAGVRENPSTLLDVTDLVFIDMVGAGYSRPEPGVKGDQFWTVDGDVDSFSRFIRAWLRENGRELSPKFLLGESYGTLRAAALSYQLQSAGVAINGVMLTGAVLDFGVLFPAGNDQSFVSYLPSLAAVAWYHRRAGTNASDLPSFLDEARAFASGPYRQALAKGHDIPAEEAKSIAARYAELTGLPAAYVLGANLRVEPENFRKELLRSEGVIVGRFDGRFRGSDSSGVGAVPESDPSNTVVEPNLTASLQAYLRTSLKYEPALPYRFGIQSLPGFDFDFKHQPPVGAPQLTPNTAIDLAAAMRLNIKMKVIFLNGYYDLATPFAAAEFDASHMLLPPALRANLSLRYYAAGHMLYFDDSVLVRMHDDLAGFIKDAVKL